MNNTHLFEVYDFEAAWINCIGPWIESFDKDDLFSRSFAVLTPQVNLNNAIKYKIVSSQISSWGLKWYTPGSIRTTLVAAHKLVYTIALREDLRFLLSLAAADLSQNLLAQSMLKEPEVFLRQYDLLMEGGHSVGAFPSQASKELAQRLEYYIEQCGITTVQVVDRNLSKQKPCEPLWDKLLIYGFSQKNWNTYPLLQAACKHSNETTLCLLTSGSGVSSEVWQGSWEERAGAVSLCTGEPLRNPLASVSEAMEFGKNHADVTYEPELRIASHFNEEVDAIVAQLCEYLNDSCCERLGIVFPSQSSPLARAVGCRLEKLKIPHYDSIGFSAGEDPDLSLLKAWIVWQEESRLDAFETFLDVLLLANKIKDSVRLELQKVFKTAFRELMTDDYTLLLSWVSTQRMTEEAKGFFSHWRLLPKEGLFSCFKAKVTEVLNFIGNKDIIEHLDNRSHAFVTHFKVKLSSQAFLKWLREVSAQGGRVRTSLGREPFARVQLVTTDNVLGQPWSHLIMVGLVKNEWESDYFDSTLMSDDYLYKLNASKTRTGGQGEGHLIIKEGYSYILNQSDRKRLSHSTFKQILALPTCEIAFTASLKGNGANVEDQLVSDLLMYAFWLCTGVFLEKEQLLRYHARTRYWLKDFREKRKVETDDSVQQTRIAFESRRDHHRPFGKYEYGFEKKPDGALKLSCKAWEEAIQHPSSVWYKHVLGVEKKVCAKEMLAFYLAQGIWIHDWLAWGAGKTIVQRPAFEQWEASIVAQAEEQKRKVETIYAKEGKSLPLWWEDIWMQALRKAKDLLKAVYLEDKRCEFLLSEYTLSKGVVFKLDGMEELPLRGRIDLVWLEKGDSLKGNHAWIVDYKTGHQEALTPNKIKKGEGLQLLLYALALRDTGCRDVLFSILNAEGVLKEQLVLDEKIDALEVLRRVGYMYKTGIFGQRGSFYNEYSFSPDFPLATLSVPEWILDKKWEMAESVF